MHIYSLAERNEGWSGKFWAVLLCGDMDYVLSLPIVHLKKPYIFFFYKRQRP